MEHDGVDLDPRDPENQTRRRYEGLCRRTCWLLTGLCWMPSALLRDRSGWRIRAS